MRTSTCFAEKDLLKRYDGILKNALSNAEIVFFTDTLFTQSVLPSRQSGLSVSSAQLLALPAFQTSAVAAIEALEHQFEDEIEDKEFICDLEEW